MGQALKWSKTKIKSSTDWKSVKLKLIERFKRNLSVQEKVELRRNLKQHIGESCQDFLNRCKKCQFLICDDDLEFITERDILINYLLGLREDYYELVIQNDHLNTLEGFFLETLKLEALTVIKEEEPDDLIKNEDHENGKTELNASSKEIVKINLLKFEPKLGMQAHVQLI